MSFLSTTTTWNHLPSEKRQQKLQSDDGDTNKRQNTKPAKATPSPNPCEGFTKRSFVALFLHFPENQTNTSDLISITYTKLIIKKITHSLSRRSSWRWSKEMIEKKRQWRLDSADFSGPAPGELILSRNGQRCKLQHWTLFWIFLFDTLVCI